MSKLNKIKATGISVIQNLSAPIADIAIRLQMINPEWGLAISMGVGLLSVWKDLAEDTGIELLEFIEQHKNEFAEEVVKTPEFKAAFLNVWEMHIRESSETKRERLRNFLLSLGKGKKIKLDLHTKIYTVIEQMTNQEAEIFGHIFRGANRTQFSRMNLSSTATPGLKDFSEFDLQDAYNSLHAYRLITIAAEPTIGAIMTVRQITPFGELFYDFVCESTKEA